MNFVRPYLSVVATARNDDHGANLLRRLQTFINALADQAKLFQLPLELVLVEWNPPLEKPPLAEALRWPTDPGPFQVRIVTVPAALHQRYRFSQQLPLYQMIGKNVGIRRALGEFILATNIDILLSDELMSFISLRSLQRDRMYRIDRHDVDGGVPVDASVEERLAYCKAHRLRINAIEGTFPLTPEGFRKPSSVDITPPNAGIFFGAGWYPPEQRFGQLFRWASDEAELGISPASAHRILILELEPGPGTAFLPFEIEALDSSGSLIGSARIAGRTLLRLRVDGPLRLRVAGGGRRSPVDGRVLNFRAVRCEWDLRPPQSGLRPISATPAPLRRIPRAWQTITRGLRFVRDLRRAGPGQRIGLPFPPFLFNRLQVRTENYGLSIALGGKPASASPPAEAAPALLHTNACGDFTMAHRDHWFELRGYPELDLYSMNIDSLFCYMAHYGGAREQILLDPMRIYHIEHAAGSGWTPEGSRILFDRLAARGVPWLEFDEVLHWAAQMERLHTTLVFNGENWGLGEFSLPDATIPFSL